MPLELNEIKYQEMTIKLLKPKLTNLLSKGTCTIQLFMIKLKLSQAPRPKVLMFTLYKQYDNCTVIKK